MSEDAKEKWRIKVSSMADTETLLKRDAEKLIYDAAVALGKPGMRALAKEVRTSSKTRGWRRTATCGTPTRPTSRRTAA